MKELSRELGGCQDGGIRGVRVRDGREGRESLSVTTQTL